MGADQAKIAEALSVLDHDDDELWTADGLPRMDAIEILVGDISITRKDVTDVDPEFCRDVAMVRCEAKRITDAEAKIPSDEQIEVELNKGNTNGVQDQTQKAQEVDPEEALRAEILAVGKAIEELAGEQADMTKLSDRLKQHQARLQSKTMRQHSPEADTKARMVFIKSQHEQLLKRHEKGCKILAALGKDGMNPSSPIDRAMSRKTARGTRRPQPRTPNQE